jgi:hypothetical protein
VITTSFVPREGSIWPAVEDWIDDDWRCWLRQHQWDDEAISQYLNVDRYRYGLGFLPDGTLAPDDADPSIVNWLYHPTPKGVTLHAATTPNILWGGSAGGTKSYGARWEAVKCSLRYHDFRTIIIRRELEELRRTHIDKLEREIERINAAAGTKRLTLSPRPPVLIDSVTGSKIIFGHCNSDGDEDKYLSEDYDLFVGDEATRLLKGQITGIAGRLRNDEKKFGRISRMILTTNPGGPAHDYCVTRFITKNVSREENKKYDPADYTFIRASLYDNPYYMDRDGTYTSYEKRLYEIGGARQKQLLDGDWTAVVGQFFGEFDAAVHVRDLMPLPPGCKVERWIRWGYAKAAYVLYAILLPNGRVYLYDEQLYPQTVAALVAGDVRRQTAALVKDMPMKIGRAVGHIEMTKGAGLGESYADTFMRAGVTLWCDDTDPIQGWGRLRHWLCNAPDGQPWLMIHPRCVYAIKTLAALVQDDDKPDDISDGQEDQAAHALRVGLMARPAPRALKPPKPEVLPDSIRAMINGATGYRRIGQVM